MWKLIVSMACCTIVFKAMSQDTSSVPLVKNPILIFGVNTNPFNIEKSYSASTTYVVEAGLTSSSTFIKLAFGFHNYQQGLNSPHEDDYRIKGYFLEPGVTFYLGNPVKKSTLLFVSTTGYFASFKHELTLDVEDANWGTKQRFNYETRTTSTGLRGSFGALFSFSPKFKLTSAIGIGFYFNKNTPFNNIYRFENASNFAPGMGYGSRIPVSMNIGLCYIVD